MVGVARYTVPDSRAVEIERRDGEVGCILANAAVLSSTEPLLMLLDVKMIVLRYWLCALHGLPSFPTRRSSDLRLIRTVGVVSSVLPPFATTPVTGSTSSVTWLMIGTPGATSEAHTSELQLLTTLVWWVLLDTQYLTVAPLRLNAATVRSDVFWPMLRCYRQRNRC